MPPTCASGLLRQAGRFSTNCHTGCPSNTENRHAVSRILAGTKQHAPGSRSNILPGSAPALHSVILYPFSPLPLPLLRHPITLTPDTGAAPDAAISLRFCRQTHGLAHIMGIDDTGTMWRDCRLG